MAELAIANPLPQALAHYVRELQETLERIGVSPETCRTLPVEGDPGLRGKLRMLLNAVQNPRIARSAQLPVLLTWPSLGLLDTSLWGSLHTRNFVVLHDPVPIRRQVGYDRVSRRIAQHARRGAPVVVTHSEDASRIAGNLLPRHPHAMVRHPVLTSQVETSCTFDTPTVVVAGQYKPERDLDLLRRIGQMLPELGAQGRIYGRGWPEVTGWIVESRYLTEHEMDEVLGSASVVVVPYRRYFQSGIALRALELGTMSLSPENSFARDVFGAAGIVVKDQDAESWAEAIHRITSKAELPRSTFLSYQARSDASWRELLSGESLVRNGGTA